jgi:hypothetical protein
MMPWMFVTVAVWSMLCPRGSRGNGLLLCTRGAGHARLIMDRWCGGGFVSHLRSIPVIPIDVPGIRILLKEILESQYVETLQDICTRI